MDLTHPEKVINNEEKIINIYVIQENDDSNLINSQEMLYSNSHFPEAQSIVNVSPSISDDRLKNCLSSWQSNNKSLFNSFSNASQSKLISTSNLYKSQGLTIGQAIDDSTSNVASVSNINNSSAKAKQMEKKTTFSLLQNSNKASYSQTYGKGHRFSKHRSINIPIDHNGLDALTTGLVKSQGQSALKTLVATPDSGFCTPSSGINEESLSLEAFESSTPKSSREGRQAVLTRFRETVSLNKAAETGGVENVDHENESSLDKSLNCVQWLQTFSTEEPLKFATCSQSNQSSKLVEKSFYHKHSDQVRPTTTTKQPTVPPQTVTPLLNFASVPSGSQQDMSASSNLQKRKVLQELDTNRSYGATTVAEPKKTQFERPSYSYMDLIKIALKHSADGQLTVKEILSWIEDHFPYFKYKAKKSWKSSIRCNLSMHSDFTKVEDKKRGGKWKVTDDAKSYMHRLPKPPVIKQPKVPAVTNIKTRRSGLHPILPRTVPYALVPLPLVTLEPGNSAQQLQQQALSILHNQHQVIQLPLQVQQIHKKQQLQENVNTSQQLSSSSSLSSSQRIKPKLPQIAPKLQHDHTGSTWNPQSVIISNNRKGKISSSSPNESELVHCNIATQQTPENVGQSSFNTSSQKKIIYPSSNVLQPVDIQIQPGNQSNEKKIVFYLKQKKNQSFFNNITSSEANEHSSQCNAGVTQTSNRNNFVTSSKARSVHKTVDKFQRSRSFDTGYRNAHIRPYNKDKREGSQRKISAKNLVHFLAEDKENDQNNVKMQLENDNALLNGLSKETRDAIRKTVMCRPDSAPTKCIIQQAWDQADFLNDDMEHDSGLLDEQTSSIPGSDILNSNLDERIINSKNLPSFIPYHIDCHTDQVKNTEERTHQNSRQMFQSIDIPENSIKTHIFHATTPFVQPKELDDGSCKQANSRSKSSRKSELVSRCGVIAQVLDCKKLQHYAGVNKTLSGKSKVDLELNKQEWLLQEKQNNVYVSPKTMSASKIVFSGLPNSSTSPNVVNSDSAVSMISSQEVFSQPSFPTLCPTEPRFCRTKSRRKQIHTLLTTDISPDSAISLPESSTALDVIRNKPNITLNITTAKTASPNSTVGNLYTNQSPFCETDQIDHTTSSPNSDNPCALDFARFLSNLSSSPYKNPCMNSAINTSLNPAEDENIPFSSSFSLTSKHSFSNEEMNVQDSSPAMSKEIVLSSPVSTVTASALTSTPCHMTRDPHLCPSDTNFLNSSPLLLSSHCHKENVSLSPSGPNLSHFLSLTSTPPAGDLSISTTPTRGMHLPVEMLHVPANSSGFLDSSLFDTLDSLMQNSLYEFKTP